MSKLLSLCEHEHLICGVSNPFSTVTSMRYYYEQAVKAIELNGLLNLPENLYEYKNVALYDLINNVAQSRKVGFYCHPALLQLMEYDKQNGSQLALYVKKPDFLNIIMFLNKILCLFRECHLTM